MSKLYLRSAACIVALFFIAEVSNAQTTYYGYQSRSRASSSTATSCDDMVNFLKSEGRYLHTSFGGYSSSAIEKISWYEYDDVLFCLVQFKWGNDFGKKSSKPYLYGGWSYDFSSYYDFKGAFEKSDSKGAFFWQYIESAKIDCD
jgi:hypothetical protein